MQRTYEELAQHYGTTVLPARPAHPRDKAKVEVAVQIAQRWLLARIRNEVFHSLGELNARLRELLVDLNAREMRRYGKSRRVLFEEIERAALRPLPRRGAGKTCVDSRVTSLAAGIGEPLQFTSGQVGWDERRRVAGQFPLTALNEAAIDWRSTPE